MKKIFVRIFTVLLVLTLSCASLPISVFAEELQKQEESNDIKANDLSQVNNLGFIELNDGYISVKVSTANGGYYMSTVEGDVISKSDNNSDLVYSDSTFDTSFTSFRITRDGKAQDYIFGRDYSYLGVDCTPVTVYKSADNAVVAEWQVDGILFTQTVALMGADSYQHGMMYISYSAKNTSDRAVDSIKARVMMDTALGQTDYAYYMLAQPNGSYVQVEEEKTVSGSDYYNYFFAYDDKVSPNVTAYTLNGSINGEAIVPEKVTFAHWYNLASNVFDYTPSVDDPLKYTELYADIDYLTQDSAVALYYDMSKPVTEAGESAISLYYGVYSNYNAGDSDVALNFTSSGTMFFNDDETAYKDINGNLPGNFSTTLKIQNIADKDISKLAVAIYPEEEILPYNGDSIVSGISAQNPYYKVINDLKVGEVNDVRFDFKIDPTLATGYRRIKIVVYDISAQSTFDDNNTILEDELFILCPGAAGSEVGFTGMTPESVFVKGTRYAYITGTNFGLIRDKTQYRIILRPQNGGEDVILDQDKVVINIERNTATLVLDMELDPSVYDVVIDWNDSTIEDMTSDALKLLVTDVPKAGDPGYVSSGVYGIAAIIRNGRSYDIVNYASEEEYNANKPEEKDIMLVMRGNFNFLSTEEKGNFKAEAITLMEGDTIIINDTIEVRQGRVTVSKIYDGDKQTSISVDIEGKVYTTKENTKIWDGILAITSFEEGKKYTLPVYSETGEYSIREGEEGAEFITLLWPGAAGGSQTLAGLLLNFRYGEFALMEQGDKEARVIAFGASLDPSILVPSGKLGTQKYYSNLEKKQLEMGVSGYTAEQLRANDTAYKKDQANWRAEQAGTLNLYMDDILFGAGGFIGFNTMIEVGIPSYADGLPYVEGELYLKVINDYWEFGVEGEADMMIFEMEASLHFKSYNSIPVPDSFYFFIGGVTPGLPVDPFGVFWVRGAGAGIGEIYETFFGSQLIPPLTLMISGEFALFAVLSARADIAISAQGFSGYLNNVGVAGITVIDRIGGEIYWYPDFSIAFSVRVDIFDAIVGEGAIVARETDEGFYFGGYAKVTIRIPRKIWLIGGIKVGEAAVGIDTKKVWGSVKVIGIGVGVVYYWGGSVDVSVGRKLSTPEPITLQNIPVYVDEETGDTLYMSVVNPVRYLASSTGGDVSLEDLITSSEDRMRHSVDLQVRDNEDALISVTYAADNRYMAEDIKNSLTASIGGAEYALSWYNDNYDADSEANKGTNAIFRYDEETKTATVSLSVTDPALYGSELNITSPVASEVELYTIVKSVVFDEVSINEELNNVTLKGSGLDKLSKLSIYAADADGALYPMGEYDTSSITSDTVQIPVTVPQGLSTGAYTLKAIGIVTDENGIETETPMVDSTFTYVNPMQPKAPTLAKIELAGNYSLSLSYNSGESYDGIMANIYEVTENGLVETVFSGICAETTENSGSIVLGGRTLNVGLEDSASEGGEETYTGLEAGKKYVVSLQNYTLLDDGTKLLSVPITSNEIEMVTPEITELSFGIEGAISTKVGTTKVEVDMINTNDFTISIDGGESVLSATYTLNGGEKTEWSGGDIIIKDLEDGTYTLRIEGISRTNDSFSALYQFTVDTESPSMLISSPQGGGFFKDGTITVTGITEADARIEITVLDSDTTVEGYADGSGSFSIEVPLDESLAYQDIIVYSYDAAENRSMPFGCTLTNDILGDPELEVVVLYQGREVNSLVCSEEAKQLQMAFKSGNKYVTVNENASAASRIEWRVQTIEKKARISEGGLLTGDNGAEGIVIVSLDNKSAIVNLESVDLAGIDITPVIPEGGFVYNGIAQTPEFEFGTDEELIAGVDYTVSFLNNTNAGLASAIITATENGKCVGTTIVNFSISRRNINDTEATVELDLSNNPTVKLTVGDYVLIENTDYTVTVKEGGFGKNLEIVIVGIGNFEERLVIVPDGSSGFNPWHLLWIIPLSLLVLGGIGGGIAIFAGGGIAAGGGVLAAKLKKGKKKKKDSNEIGASDEESAPDREEKSENKETSSEENLPNEE